VIPINAHHVGHYFCFYLGSGSKLWLPQSIQISSAWYSLRWVQSLDWTTGLDYWTHPTAKYNSFSTEQKLNFLISSVTSLANTAPYSIFPGVSRGQRSRAYLIRFTPWWLLCLNPVEFKQALSTHELYQQEGNTYLLESTFTKLSIENLVPERIRRAFYFIEINL